MKKKNIFLNKGFLFLLVFSVSLLQACEKEEATVNPPAVGPTPVSYSYTNPVNIKITSTGGAFMPIEVVTNNYIFSYINVNQNSTITIFRYPIGSTSQTLFTTNLGLLGFNVSPPQGISLATNNHNKYGLFTVDKSESIVYFLSKSQNWMQIFKWDLASGQVTKLLPDFSNGLDFLVNSGFKCMRIANDGTIYIASMANNGCIVKVNSTTGVVFTIASNLINPGYFDINNGSLYVPINSASGGKVIRIDQNNAITDVRVNLTGPTNVAIDNYGNLVVRSQTTIDGGNYHRYDMFNMSGINISNVRDASGVSILSNTMENTPMTFDSYNNLYFFHADGVVSGGITNNNPIGQRGLFKIGIIKN